MSEQNGDILHGMMIPLWQKGLGNLLTPSFNLVVPTGFEPVLPT